MSGPATYLDPKKLPRNLWDPDAGILRISENLARCYEALIDRYGLRALAGSRTRDDSPVGGIDQASTNQHFAQQFDNSAARAQLALTNVTGEVGAASDALVRALSGGTICLTDAPCGAGAASLAFLSTIAELRKARVLPRMPLEVRLLGAEISPYAREYANQLLEDMRSFLESQAITVNAELVEWNATDALSNTDLIQTMIRGCPLPNKQLLVIANFSGFLSRSGKMREVEPQLSELFRHSSGPGNVAIWIEPQMNEVTAGGGVFSQLGQKVSNGWQRFVRLLHHPEESPPYMTSTVYFESILAPGQRRPIRLAVMRLDLERT
jgi:hypothetical protein